jgi:guanine deaminase
MMQITRDTRKEPKSRSKVFIGRIVQSKSLKDLEILPKAALGVTKDGTISFLDSSVTSVDAARAKYSSSSFADAEYTTLTPTQFLFPGLIDTHLHAPQWPNLAIGMEGNLREWCENYTDPIEASYSDTAKARRVYSDVVQTTLKLGSTTVAYNSSIHADATNVLADMCLKYGQRAVVGKLCILVGSTRGNWEESSEQSLADSEKSIKYMRRIDPEAWLLHPCVQPRGGPYCPPDLMGGLGDLSHKYQEEDGRALRVQAHMCETTSDRDRTLELHKKFKSYTEMYNAYGMLHSRSILAHCIHLSETDMKLLQETKAGVAHNPNSNTCLRDGECRVRELLNRGIKVGLGTDCSAGYMPSITDAMRSASNVSRYLAMKTGEEKWMLDFEECVYLATVGGAEVVGLEDKIGNFEPGKEFDALLVDVNGLISVGEWDGEGKEGGLALVKKWVFLGDDRHIRGVWVGGERVVG